NIALVHPHLHADSAVGGVCVDGGKLDVCTQCVQRHAAFHLGYRAAHLGTAESTAHLDLHALGTAAHGLLDSMLHGTSVRHAALDLLRNAFGDQPCIGFRNLDLFDAEVDLLANLSLDEAANALNVCTLLADNDARLGSVKRDIDLVRTALKRNASNTSSLEFLFNEVANRNILVQQLSILLFCVPIRLPLAGNTQAEAYWMYFTTH